jgi:O-antigen ligase
VRRECLLIVLVSSFIFSLFIIYHAFAHEVTVPKALSGLALFWISLPFFLFYLHERGRVDLPLFLPFFLLLLTFLISGFSLTEFTSKVVDREDYLSYLYIIVTLYLMFLAVYNLKPTVQEKKVFLGILFSLAVIEALTGLLQYKGFIELLEQPGTARIKVSGTVAYSNYLGFFLCLGIMTSLYLWLEYEEWFRKEKYIRGVAFLFMVGFIFAVLNITGSRAGMVDALIGLIVFLFLSYRYIGGVWLWGKRRIIGYFIAALIVASLTASLSSKEAAVREFSGSVMTTPGSSGDRAVMWLSALDMFKDYPLTGVGLGNFSNHFSTYMGQVVAAHRSDFFERSATFHLHTHNDYLEILSETGVLGLAAFFIFCFILIGRIKKFLAHADNGEKNDQSKLYKIALVSLTIPFLSDAVISLPFHFFPFLLLLAIIIGQILPDKRERGIPLKRGASKITVVVIVAISFINLLTLWDVGKADLNLEKGFRTRNISYMYKAMENPLIRTKTIPFYSQLLFWGGEAQGNRKLMDEGIKVMEDHYTFQPTAQVAHKIGEYYLSLDEEKKAMEWWQKGLYFQPNYRPILHSIERLSAPRAKKKVNIFETLSKKINKNNLNAKKSVSE